MADAPLCGKVCRLCNVEPQVEPGVICGRKCDDKLPGMVNRLCTHTHTHARTHAHTHTHTHTHTHKQERHTSTQLHVKMFACLNTGRVSCKQKAIRAALQLSCLLFFITRPAGSGRTLKMGMLCCFRTDGLRRNILWRRNSLHSRADPWKMQAAASYMRRLALAGMPYLQHTVGVCLLGCVVVCLLRCGCD